MCACLFLQAHSVGNPRYFDPATLTLENAQAALNAWVRSAAASEPCNPDGTNGAYVETISPEDDKTKAAEYLSSRWFGTKTQAAKICKAGHIQLNGRKIFATQVLMSGDEICIDFAGIAASMKPSTDALSLDDGRLHRLLTFARGMVDQQHRRPPLHVIYEDSSMAVVCKPAGLHSMQWVGTMKKQTFALDDILPLLLSPPMDTDTVGNSDSPVPHLQPDPKPSANQEYS